MSEKEYDPEKFFAALKGGAKSSSELVARSYGMEPGTPHEELKKVLTSSIGRGDGKV
jgi:hypothetical protein